MVLNLEGVDPLGFAGDYVGLELGSDLFVDLARDAL